MPWRKPVSIKVMTAVWENAPVRQGSLLVLLALADFASDNGLCWPSVETLAKKARLKRRHTQDILWKLERLGWITREVGTGPYGANHYRVNLEGVQKMHPARFPADGGANFAEGGRGGAHPNRQLKNRHTESSGSRASSSTKTLVRLMREKRKP